jgi:hypothetical protein
MISDPAARKKLFNSLQEASDSMTRIAAERDLIKEIVKAASEEHGVEKKVIAKMARIYYKQNFDQEVKEFQDMESLYEIVTGRSSQE